jgi:hypothetical protein
MKSAYDLAMERLQKQAPSAKLTEQQKAEIAEIDSLAKAKSAERELFLKEQIHKAEAGGKFDEVQQLQDELARDLRRIKADAETKKEKIRESRA